MSDIKVCESAQDPLAFLKQTTANAGKALWLKKTVVTEANRPVKQHFHALLFFKNAL